jgi:hypothetical protein
MILRPYGPLQPWFDKTWRPRDPAVNAGILVLRADVRLLSVKSGLRNSSAASPLQEISLKLSIGAFATTDSARDYPVFGRSAS